MALYQFMQPTQPFSTATAFININNLIHMKITYCLTITLLLCITACQKSVDPIMGGNDPIEDSTNIPTILGDTIMYEVISTDTSGWFGMWMDEQSRLTGNQL